MNATAPICAIGACNVDLTGRSTAPLKTGDSNPGRISTAWGGVARNVAENLARLGLPVSLLSALGDDGFAPPLRAALDGLGVGLTALTVDGLPTPSYVSVLAPDGEMVVAVSDMRAIEALDEAFVEAHSAHIAQARIGFIDANLSSGLIGFVLRRFPAVAWFLDPVSTTKATRVIAHLGLLDTVTPNLLEAQALTGIAGSDSDAVSAMGDALLEAGVGNVFISLSGDGLFFADGTERGFVRTRVADVVSVSGAGDAQIAGLIHARTRGAGIVEAACWGLALGSMTLGCEPTVNPALTEHRLSIYHEQIVIERY